MSEFQDWLHLRMPDVESFFLTAAGSEGMARLEKVAQAAIDTAGYQASLRAEQDAREQASIHRSKIDAYNAGFKAGSQENITAAGRLEALATVTERAIAAAADAALDRCTAVYSALADGDPRFQLATQLLLKSGMDAAEIAAAVNSIPTEDKSAATWMAFMERHHAIGAPGADSKVTTETADPAKPTAEQRAEFLKGLGMTPGVKMTSHLYER